MERTTVPKEAKELTKTLDFIFHRAMGNPILFEDEPALADMEAETWGKNSTNLYIKFADNTGLKISGTSMS